MFVDQHKEVEHDLTKPRIAVYKNNWKIHQNTVYRCNLRVAQSKGLQFCQTRSNAITLHNTSPAVCIERVVNSKCISLLSYSKELFSNRICIMDAKIQPTLKREHPSTILAERTGQSEAVESTGRPVAATSTSESKDCHIQLSNNKITRARKQSKI